MITLFGDNMRLFEVATNDIKAFASTLEAKYDLSSLWLYNYNDDTIKLDSIIVNRDARKQGVGSAVMQEITDYADERGLRVALTPNIKDPVQGTTSRSRLVKFYKRFGFKENKGRSKDFTISAGMIREPQ